jgi:hypothetical protein
MRGAAGVVALWAGVCAFGQAPPKPLNPAIREAVGYLLTTDKLDKYAQASRNVTALIAKDPGYREKMKPEEKDAPRNADQTVEWAKAHLPEYVAAVEKAGIPFREYIVAQTCLVITVEAYKQPRYAASLHVRRENMAFVQGNWVKIQGILAQQRR